MILHRLRGAFWPDHWSVRAKLILTSLLPLLVLLPMVMAVFFFLGNDAYERILTAKLRSDLSIANQYFERIQANHILTVKSIAASEQLTQGLRGNANQQNLPNLLTNIRDREQFSYLIFRPVNQTNQSRVQSNVSESADHSDFVDDKALSQGNATSLSILSASMLEQIDPALATQAKLDIVFTPNASPDERKTETRGLVLQSASKVLVDGRVVGVLEAGTLLNRNLDLVANLSDLVYPQDSLFQGSRGAATIFLGDVRIATTVQSVDGQAALGTRVSSAVHDKVLGRGDVWLEKAFVVNDWYMSGYLPLNNLAGYRVGMLYVGFLETPYRFLRENIAWGIIISVVIAAVLGIRLVVVLAAGIFDPLLRMNDTMSRVESGDDKARVGNLARDDEFGLLAKHFDELLEQLSKRQQELLAFNHELDQRVSSRTSDLLQANELLQKAQKQLLSSEKLATMGQLTAGLAHEINNPLAVMQGHLDLMRHSLMSHDVFPSIQLELRLLDEQIQRMRVLVEKLLQFARPDSYVGYAEPIDINLVICDSIVLVEREIKESGAKLEFNLQATEWAQISRTELQQVLVNLLVNASHAVVMNKEQVTPVIEIQTNNVQVEGEPAVQILVKNTGPMIEKDRKHLIFELFYTTKRQTGTGLGLPVSRMLVERYGGALSVESPLYVMPSNEAHGTQFLVTVRCKARYSSDMIRAAIFKTQQSGAVTLESGSGV